MQSNRDLELRKRLVRHLKGGQAFATIDNILEQIPFEKTGIKPDGLPYSFYQQMYHIRVAQLDILDYCRNENYKTPDWPDDYWPDDSAPADKSDWDTLVQNYFDERDEFCDMIMDTGNALFEPFESNPDHNMLRQAELVIEHTAYHTGQLYVLYRLLNE